MQNGQANEILESQIIYGIDDTPNIVLCLFLGFQQYLTMFGSTIAVPFALQTYLCIGVLNFEAVGKIISTIFFVSGLATLIQTSIGIRLPIVQGATFSLLVPTMTLMQEDKWRCTIDLRNSTPIPGIDYEDLWQSRIREIQGAILISSLFQVVAGATGAVGLMLKFIGPLTIAPGICLVGLSLFSAATSFSSVNWPIAILTIFLITLFSQVLGEFSVPIYYYSFTKSWTKIKVNIFKLFPVLLAVLTMWLISFLSTIFGVFTDDPSLPQYEARTDAKLNVISQSQWFAIPYPFQWGWPTFSVAGILGMLPGIIASMIESIGDYYACARLSKAPPPPISAINRGVLAEGIGSIIAAMWGSGNGTTSYSENIGAIGITKVASRRVIQVGALIMIGLATFGKFGALFSTIPKPVVGGIFYCMFAMIVGVGLSNVQFIDLNSSRNLFVLGFSIFSGLAIPSWLADDTNAALIAIGLTQLDKIILVLLKTNMFVAAFTGFVLDNLLPGSKKSRGLLAWKADDSISSTKTYEVPFLKENKLFKLVPFCTLPKEKSEVHPTSL